MIRFLLISFLVLSLPAHAGELSNPALTEKVDTKSVQNLIEESKKRYPFDQWKTIGFCGFKKEPLMTMKVPKFLKWDPNCTLHTVKDGVEYCGPDESSPRLTGEVEIGGKKKIIQVGMEAFASKKPYKSPFGLWIFDDWSKYGALLSRSMTTLGGHEAYLGEIEDASGKLPMPSKVMTLIYVRKPYIGATLYFIEGEKDSAGNYKFTRHSDRIFQWAFDKIKDSFEFKAKVEDKTNKSRELKK